MRNKREQIEVCLSFLFDEDIGAKEYWLSKKREEFGDKSAYSLIETEAGLDIVLEKLMAIVHGIHS